MLILQEHNAFFLSFVISYTGLEGEFSTEQADFVEMQIPLSDKDS
jgi:hypothetical protein